MTRFRNSPPPFEVMKGGPSIRSNGTGPSEQSVAPLQPGPSSSKGDGWWARAQQPMVVRLPSGLAVGVIGAILGVIVLAYWVGQTRGYHQGQRQLQAVHTVLPSSTVIAGGRSAALPLLNNRISEMGPARIRPESVQSGGREVGLNYFVLAHYPQADASRLVEFLRGQGVESAAYRAQNKKFFQVVALHGFAKKSLYSPQRQAFEEQLRQLGRAWKEQRQGPDFAKSGIYLDLYEGESAVETIP